MKLSWSHAVLHVKDLDEMLDFYTDILGFTVSDRGPLGDPNGPQIVFLTQDPDEHHQLAMMTTRPEDGETGSLDHFAFRVDTFKDVKALNQKLTENSGTEVLPLSHGNTLSLYFKDPEGNGIEVFWDTPWHVAQPQGKVWDTGLDKEAGLAWVKENFSQEASFEPREDYYTRARASNLGS